MHSERGCGLPEIDSVRPLIPGQRQATHRPPVDRSTRTGPAVLCPFMPRISLHAAEVNRLAVHWATRHGLLPNSRARATFAKAKFANLMARTYPEATGADLSLATSWLTVVFAIDDTLETALGRDPVRLRAVADVLMTHLHDAPMPGGGHRDALDRDALDRDALDRDALGRDALGRGLVGAFDEVWRRTVVRTSPAWQARFRRHFREYLDGNAWEADNRAAGRTPAADEYRMMRQRTAATAIFFDLIEPFRRVELPADVHDDADVIALRRHAAHVVAWFNDLVSWQKEEAAGDQHNLVLVLRAERRLSTIDAVYTTVALHDAEVIAFVEARDRVLAGPHAGTPGVAEVVADLVHWIRGNIDWSMETGRYEPP